jgi:hypothetical protein
MGGIMWLVIVQISSGVGKSTLSLSGKMERIGKRTQ